MSLKCTLVVVPPGCRTVKRISLEGNEGDFNEVCSPWRGVEAFHEEANKRRRRRRRKGNFG